MSQINKDNIVYTIYNEHIKTTNGSKSKPKRENKMNTLTLNNITFTHFEDDFIPKDFLKDSNFVATIERDGVCYFHLSNVKIVPFASFHGEMVFSSNAKLYHSANAVVV